MSVVFVLFRLARIEFLLFDGCRLNHVTGLEVSGVCEIMSYSVSGVALKRLPLFPVCIEERRTLVCGRTVRKSIELRNVQHLAC